MKRVQLARVGVVAGTLIALSGCSFTGVNSYSLPFSKGGSSDSLNATVLLENATNLVPNSEVKYGEITVGSVRKIELDGWTAKLTIGLEPDVEIPADVTAKVAQKSLLGAEYLELKAPEGRSEASAAGPRLAQGDTIGLERTERYPETEEVLSAASLLLNGGGLPQVQSISREVNYALSGRTETAKNLVERVDTTAGRLDDQRDSIFRAMGELRDLSSTLNDRSDTVTKALDSLPAGVDAIEDNRVALEETLASLAGIRDVGRTALVPNGDKLGEILNNLQPITKAVADLGPNSPKLVQLLSYPFPSNTIAGYTRSDYLNLYATFSINANRLTKGFTGLSPLDGALSGVLGLPEGGAEGATDPLGGPLGEDPTGLVDDLLGGLGGGASSQEKKKSDGASTPSPKSSSTETPSRQPNLLEQLLGGN